MDTYREDVTSQLVALMEQGNDAWVKPWQSMAGNGRPHNPVTGHNYSGGNVLWLMATGYHRGYRDNRWATYKQAAAKGWQVRKGERGTQVEFWQFTPADQDHDKRALHRVYTVFNLEQMDGAPPRVIVTRDIEPIAAAEQIIARQGATIVPSDHAAYSPSRDCILMPDMVMFTDAPAYYGTFLHELGHWTGHETRLNRPLSTDFGSEEYAAEELRAEIASVLLSAETGIPYDASRSAAYLKSWAKRLRGDKHEVFKAAREAGQIVDYLTRQEV
jgi:antirestriction protein ArdC